jgi:excisionase family DNA binding protein
MATDAAPSRAALERLLTASTFADQTDIPLATVYELVRTGRIPHVRIGRAVRFSPTAVAEWMEAGGTGYDGPES